MTDQPNDATPDPGTIEWFRWHRDNQTQWLGTNAEAILGLYEALEMRLLEVEQTPKTKLLLEYKRARVRAQGIEMWMRGPSSTEGATSAAIIQGRRKPKGSAPAGGVET